MYNKHAISIIVPVYMVEKYLSGCIDSILSQTLKNIEVILVDDGSKDRSGEICNNYAKKDYRVRVYHKDNGGVSSARSFGLEKSTGKYVMFVDSDDTLPLNCVEILYNIAEKYNCDITLGEVCDVKHGNKSKSFDKKDVTTYNSQQYLNALSLLEVGWGPYAKLIKKDILDQNLFILDKNIYAFEDLIMNLKMSFNCKLICKISTVVYFYHYRDDSASHTNKINITYYKNITDIIENILILHKHKSVETLMLNFKLIWIKFLILDKCEFNINDKWLRTILSQLKNRDNSFKDKFMLLCFKNQIGRTLYHYSFYIYGKFKKIIK